MKKYNYLKIKKEVSNLVETASYSRDNKFKSTVWEYHIEPVVKNALKLGKKLGADLEVLEMAALLHDYAGIVNMKFSKEHHLHGAELAENVLKKLNFPKEKIELVKDAIRNHRGSIKSKRETIEAKILASADAMSHFTELADMMYLVFGIYKYDTKTGVVWLKDKLTRSWKKIMPEGRKMIKKDYEIAMRILNKAIK